MRRAKEEDIGRGIGCIELMKQNRDVPTIECRPCNACGSDDNQALVRCRILRLLRPQQIRVDSWASFSPPTVFFEFKQLQSRNPSKILRCYGSRHSNVNRFP